MLLQQNALKLELVIHLLVSSSYGCSLPISESVMSCAYHCNPRGIVVSTISHALLTRQEQMHQTMPEYQQAGLITTRIGPIYPHDPTGLYTCTNFLAHTRPINLVQEPARTEQCSFTNPKINVINRKRANTSIAIDKPII